MTCLTFFDLLIGWFMQIASSISRLNRNDSFQRLKYGLCAPKTSSTKNSFSNILIGPSLNLIQNRLFRMSISTFRFQNNSKKCYKNNQDDNLFHNENNFSNLLCIRPQRYIININKYLIVNKQLKYYNNYQITYHQGMKVTHNNYKSSSCAGNSQKKISIQNCTINSSRDNISSCNIAQSIQQFVNPSSSSKSRPNSNYKNDKQNNQSCRKASINWGFSYQNDPTKKYENRKSTKSKHNSSSKGLLITKNVNYSGNQIKQQSKIPLQQHNSSSNNIVIQSSQQQYLNNGKYKDIKISETLQPYSYRDSYVSCNNNKVNQFNKNASTHRINLSQNQEVMMHSKNYKHASFDSSYQGKQNQKLQMIQLQNGNCFNSHNFQKKNSHQRIISNLQQLKQQNQSSNQSPDNNYNQKNQKTEAVKKNPQFSSQVLTLNKNSFHYESVLGKGGFGKVWKVICKKTKKIYALKQMSKALIISKKSVPSVLSQQQLLKQLSHPFIVNMSHSFQTRQNLFLVMDYLSGGDLRTNLATKKYFTQDQTKFIIICIMAGLKYLHANQVIHRDIKPENIVFDEKGYARITDLGVARKLRINNSSDTSGTPGYMAPQVLCRQNHTYSADFFAVGVIAYELMLRKRPYYGKNRKEIRDQVLSRQVQIKKQDIPDNWSLQGADFINRLIQRKPSNRLGYKGIQQIFQHPWVRNFPLQKLEKKQLVAAYIPSGLIKDRQDDDFSSQDTEIKDLIVQNQIMLRKKQVQRLFQGYEYEKRF